MSDPKNDPYKNENYLSRQRAALQEVKLLVERLEGCLRAGVRVTGEFTEAQEVMGFIKNELSHIRIPSKDPFNNSWVLAD